MLRFLESRTGSYIANQIYTLTTDKGSNVIKSVKELRRRCEKISQMEVTLRVKKMISQLLGPLYSMTSEMLMFNRRKQPW